MNRITRNLAVLLCAAVASLATIAALLFFQTRSGRPLYDFAVLNYIPAGAIGAGLIAAVVMLGCALLLRARPAPIVLIGLVVVSAGSVFLAQSAEVTLAPVGRAAAADPATFGQLLLTSVLHSQLQFTDPSHESSSSSSSPLNPGVAHALPQTAGDSDAQVQGISSGVQGVVASQDVGANVSAGGVQRIGEIGDDLHSIGSTVQNHGAQWLTMALQAVGFLLGGLLVYSFLRSRPYCDECSVLLSGKGTQKRYFDRLEEINGSVEDVLAKAKDRRLQLSINAHSTRGAAQKGKLTEFASILSVSRCALCHTHRMDFRAMRKSGASWKEIDVLAYSASSFDPIEIAG